MRKRIQAFILSLIMVLSTLTPAFTADIYAAETSGVIEETTTIKHSETKGTPRNDGNYFTFSDTGWSAMGQSPAHVWSDDPGSDPSAIWYEVKFVGHKIDIYAGKNWPMGYVKYFIDDQEVGELSLYRESNIDSTYITTIDNLTEGEHTFKAVATGKNGVGGRALIDCAKVIVYHAPYNVTNLTLADEAVTLSEGVTKQITYTTAPDYATLKGVTFESSNEAVATVDEAGIITAVAEGNATITLAAENYSETKTMEVTVKAAVPGIAGSIVDTDTQWTENRYDEVKGLGVLSKSLTAWKNDKATSEIALVSLDLELKNVTVTASDLINGDKKIAAENVTATFIKSTKAYNGDYLGYGSTTRKIPEDNGTNRSESADILYQTTPMTIPFNNVQPVWVEFAIPEDAEAGTYTGTLTVTADDLEKALVFIYEVEVQNAVLPDATEFADGFDIELWQYPYSSAEYYGVTPFSE